MKLGDICTIKYGKDHKKLNNGTIPAYGSGGIIRYVDSVLSSKPSVLIPRKGTLGNLFYVNKPFWTVDTLFWTEIEESKVLPHYLFYFLKTKNLADLNVGTAVPSLTVEVLDQVEVDIPSLDVQKRVVKFLECIDDKIAVNSRINDYLEELAQMIFDSLFYDYSYWGGTIPDKWEKGVLGDFVTVKRGSSPRPIQEYLSNSGYRWLKISDVTSVSTPYILKIKEHIKEEGLKNTEHLKAGSLVLSNSATPGIPKILAIDSCIHDGWLYFPQSEFSNEWLYCFFKNVRKDLLRKANGSVFQNLKTEIVKNLEITKPDYETLTTHQDLVAPIFRLILEYQKENQTLESLRNALLPKLMSGEIDVSKVDITQLNNHLCED